MNWSEPPESARPEADPRAQGNGWSRQSGYSDMISEFSFPRPAEVAFDPARHIAIARRVFAGILRAKARVEVGCNLRRGHFKP